MGDSKRAVRNKARVEGSICAHYVQREITYFCSHYFKSSNLLSTNTFRNDSRSGHEGVQPRLSVLHTLGRHSGRCKDDYLSDKEWKSAHVHVLINCNEVKPYLE